MIDQTSQFFATLTEVGEAKQANAIALGLEWTFAQMAVGDANGTDPVPDPCQSQLINERRRAPLNQVRIDPANANIIVAEQIIPPDAGGWWIREIGLYDVDGDLVAIANCAPSFKPLLSQGSGKTQVVRISIIVTGAAHVVLKIDPAVVLATREYVDRIAGPTGIEPGSYRSVTVNEYGRAVAGSNPTTRDEYALTDVYTRQEVLDMLPGRGAAVFKVPGIYLFDVPEGVARIDVQVWGAGGAGGSAGVPGSGGGGGAGGYGRGLFTVAPKQRFEVTVGAGGALGSETLAGGPGAASSFGALLSATGGQGGNSNHSGSGGGLGGVAIGANMGDWQGACGGSGVYWNTSAVSSLSCTGGTGGGGSGGRGGAGNGQINRGGYSVAGGTGSGGGGAGITDGERGEPAVGGSGLVIVTW